MISQHRRSGLCFRLTPRSRLTPRRENTPLISLPDSGSKLE
jgi:hypothetical protein